ncbi:hypothetical protein ACFOQM_23620 [Paenibacillus sp. GCM10012307]|uniref:Phage ABA sandwich domain-containing protein n=1 Tax=Paenibacillus roseus TaxID=2798579 RepID=A0A934JCD5_9BACL|nr:hypothetical protein [Paenibacillus roseus]MBJ6364213.1 hypothetical protein [Paenibacillus roseus]
MRTDEIVDKWRSMTLRERDVWVAEVIFGYKTFGQFYTPEGVRVLIPCYTTLYCRDVLKVMPGELYIYRCGDDSVYVASFGQSAEEYCLECGENSFDVHYQGESNTLEDAICLAAMIAKLRTVID